MTSMNSGEPGICRICGNERPLLTGRHHCAECSPIEEQARRARQALYEQYRVSPGDPQSLPMPLTHAIELVIQRVGHSIVIDPSDTCETATWWFIASSMANCCGYFVEKADGRVTELGAAHSLELCFWAQARGFRYPCDLVIDEIHDIDKTVASLHQVLLGPSGMHRPGRPFLPEVLRAHLSQPLPQRFHSQELWFQLPALHQMVEQKIASLHGEAPTPPPWPAGALRVAMDGAALRTVAENRELVRRLTAVTDTGALEIAISPRMHDTAVNGDQPQYRSPAKRDHDWRVQLLAWRDHARRRQRVPCRFAWPETASEAAPEASKPAPEPDKKSWIEELRATIAASQARYLIADDPVIASAFAHEPELRVIGSADIEAVLLAAMPQALQ